MADCPGKDAWPELVGALGEAAERVIERENPNVNAIVVRDGTIVTPDFRCDRVWVWVNDRGKDVWPELVGANGDAAATVIERQNPNVNAIVVRDGTSVTEDIRCDRVWVWVNRRGVVVRPPRIVKSAYRLIRDLKCIDAESLLGGTSSSNSQDQGWVWSLAAPPKVRLFVWSCCSGAIPVRERLKQRKIPVENLCPRCKLHSESILHCLLYCTFARQVWALSNLPYVSYWYDGNEVESWLLQIKSRTDAKDFGWAAILMWWIWFGRNKLLWENEDLQLLGLIILAREFFNIFLTASVHTRIPPANRTSAKCQPPPCPFVKINLDAAFSGDGELVGFGMIAKNGEGVCIGWNTLTFNLPLSPEAAEAIAALRAIEFGLAPGWSHLILEGDCLTVMKGISNPFASNGVLGHNLASQLESFRALHEVCECNMAAHHLAKLAVSGFSFSFDLPSVIHNIVISDLS
ncbi:hypothetical protein RD792_003386 [Penstemon davidsonii]|uniref:RNase H type-1 domain-containing protein n=1 Tax=Penstemon davidsonii TaxID=160366 RepID=A0ABR0DTM5_9LAMI|nr:hypothetical protein RD792_003386 [Penstemon davidsonii]